MIMDDCDLGSAAAVLPGASATSPARYATASPGSSSRRKRHDEMGDALSAAMGRIVVGDPLDETMQMGRSRPRSSASGWRATSQRGVPKAPYSPPGAAARPTLGRGFFIEPTVFARVDNASTIATAEIFGPVLSIIAVRDETHAVDLANDSPFGLNASVLTSDVDRAYAVVRQAPERDGRAQVAAGRCR
jgi:aldehyde dehydrogenase (NAD+)